MFFDRYANRLLLSKWVPVLVVALVGAWGSAPPTAHAAPRIDNISLRGLQIGGTTTVTIDGADLLPDPQLVIGTSGVQQAVQEGATPNRVQIAVTLDTAVEPGIYLLRIASGKGISSGIPVGIDALPQQPFADQIAQLPVALHGSLAGGNILRTRFQGTKGQRVVLDVEARRLGANFKPIVRLYDSRGAQIAWSPSLRSIGGDPRCQVELPADGQYEVELHDVLYRAGAPGFFRLKIGALYYADLVYPVGVTPQLPSAPGPDSPAGPDSPDEPATQLELASTNVPDTTRVAVVMDPAAIPGDRAAPAPQVALFTGARPWLVLNRQAEAVEGERAQPSDAQQVPAAPVGVSGRIAARGEEDRYAMSVTGGRKMRIEVLARRLGSPLDAVLTVHDNMGRHLASGDDRPGLFDPGVEFDVPADATGLVVAVRDFRGSGGRDFIYHIAMIEAVDFDITAESDVINVPAGATQAVPLVIDRKGYNGPIRLDVPGVPDGVIVNGQEIPAGATRGLLTFTAPPGAPRHALVTIVASSVEGDVPLVRTARVAESGYSRQQPWLRDEFGLAITEPPALTVAWGDADPQTLLTLGGTTRMPVQVARIGELTGPVRLRLLTTQVMPKKTIKENNADKEVDDPDRALRLVGETELAADASDAQLQIAVPADLPRTSWGLAVAADLLSADKNTVLATAVTPVHYHNTRTVMVLELESDKFVEGKAGEGETGQFTGKIVRSEGFNEPFVVALAGLPEGYESPRVEVPSNQSEFVLPVRFPFGTKEGELKDIRLMASALMNADDPGSRIESNSVTVTVKVVPGDKPPE